MEWMLAVQALTVLIIYALTPVAAEKVILLPDEDGNVGQVIVTSASEGSSRTIDSAYGAIEVGSGGRLATASESEASVRAHYGEVLDAAPPAPVSFTVYFETGSSENLTPESQRTIAQLREALSERPAPEILVIGHTDTVGDLTLNDKLSLARAGTVLALIRATGVKAVSLEASGRGERELLVATADSVDEPRNRRVEISIR